MNSSKYGDGTFDFYDSDITVIIPFNFINGVGNKVGNKTEENGLNDSQTKVLVEIRNNPNITKKELAVACRLSKHQSTNIGDTVAGKRILVPNSNGTMAVSVPKPNNRDSIFITCIACKFGLSTI